MFIFETLNENTEIRDNIHNDEVDSVKVFSSMNEETLKAITTSVNGESFDTEGNVLDSEGKVIMSANDIRGHIKDYYASLAQPINPTDYESIEIDGVKLTINDKGEAVDAEGKVVKTVDEVKAIIEEYDADTPETFEEIVAAANANLGIEFIDAEGNALEFDLNTVEGMQARDKYIVDNLAKSLADQRVEEVFGADKDFESLYMYKREHGTAEGWSPQVDYSKISLLDPSQDGADAQYTDIIVKAEVAAGRDIESAKMFAELLIGDGKGEDYAKKSLKALVDADAARSAKLEADLQRQNDARVKEINDYWASVKSVVDSGKADGIAIPAFIKVKNDDGSLRTVSRSDFYDYMSKPVKDGASAYQLYNSSMSVEERVVDALMKFTKYSGADLVKAQAADNRVKIIRKIKDNNQRKSSVTPPGQKPANERVAL